MRARRALLDRGWACLLLASIFAGIFLVGGVARSGIWDPYELDNAELARRIAIHLFDARALEVTDASNRMPTLTDLGAGELGFTSMAAGFALFGLSDWAGRLPLALWAFAGALVLFAFVARAVRPRAGLYAVIALSTMPLYFVHARTMLGDAVTMACATMAFAGLAGALLERRSWLAASGFLALGLCGLAGGALSRGIVLGVAAPLAAVGLAWLALACSSLRKSVWPGGAWATARFVLGIAALLGAAACVALGQRALDAAPGAPLSRLLGAAVVSRPPVEATFDLVVRDLGHALFPWSALLPFAFGRLFFLPAELDEAKDERFAAVGLRVALLAGAAAFYAAFAWLAPRTGALPFSGPALLAAIAAIAIDDFERGAPASGAVGIGTALVGAVLLHDLTTMPGKLLVPFGVDDEVVAKALQPASGWLLGAGAAFFALVFLAFVDRIDPKALTRWLHERVEAYRSAADELQRVWKGNLVFGFLLLEAGLVGLGAMLIIGRRLGWASVTRIPQQSATIGLNAWWFLPLALAVVPLAFDAGRLGMAGVRRVFRLPRGSGAWLGALLGGGMLSFGLYPALASQLSPREAFQRYAELHRPGEPLGTLGLRTRVLRYYAEGEATRSLASAELAAAWLMEGLSAEPPERRWLVLKERDLPGLNATWRRLTGQNLPLLDASGGEILLGSSMLDGAANENPLEQQVLAAPPDSIQHPLHATFGSELEALGWEIRAGGPDGPLVDHAVAGRPYHLRFFYRVLRELPRNYKAFLHVDGFGRRHNGDHDVLDGHYRMSLWQPGDVIADGYEMILEPNFLPGEYEVYFGFYVGRVRYEVTSGPERDDRAAGGTLVVR